MDCIKGLANGCKAACCKNLTIEIHTHSEDLLRYYRLHRCTITKLSRGKYLIIIPARCKALTDDDLCSYHGTDKKPIMCRYFNDGKTKGCWIPPKCLVKK